MIMSPGTKIDHVDHLVQATDGSLLIESSRTDLVQLGAHTIWTAPDGQVELDSQTLETLVLVLLFFASTRLNKVVGEEGL